MSTSRPRARFVPTLTEVVRPAVEAAEAPQATAVPVAAVVSANPSRSMLEAAVDDLMPQAREQLRQSLHAAAYALAEEQLRSMEEQLRQRLRGALREAAGMGKKVSETQKD